MPRLKNPPNPPDLGWRLLRWRLRSNLSQREACQALGLDIRSLRYWEGEREPHPHLWQRMLEVCGPRLMDPLTERDCEMVREYRKYQRTLRAAKKWRRLLEHLRPRLRGICVVAKKEGRYGEQDGTAVPDDEAGIRGPETTEP